MAQAGQRRIVPARPQRRDEGKKSAQGTAKKTTIRIVLAAIYIALGAFLFVSFRGHTLLVDNHDTESLTAPDMIMVSVDKEYPLAFFSGDRDRFAVSGSHHRIALSSAAGSRRLKGRSVYPSRTACASCPYQNC
ncbi:MAG: hypothetical protein LBG43_00860 [Treponema sp.]|nr:hypothetical protein [Treponema sp.]